MDLFIISKLLLLALLLRSTEEDGRKLSPSDSDSSTRFGEFCLRVKDESHWTSSESLDRPSHPTQVPTHESKTEPIIPPLNYMNGCKCRNKEKTSLNEIHGLLRSFKTQSPSESCNMLEFFATLNNGSTICTVTASFTDVYEYFQSQNFPRSMMTVSTTPTPTDPTTSHVCESCNVTVNLSDINQKVIQFITVEYTFGCPPVFNVRMEDAMDHCFESDQGNVKNLIKRTKLFPVIPKNFQSDECRCSHMVWGQEDDVLQKKSIKIWFPSETCRFIEFIETHVDGSEVCTTGRVFSEFLVILADIMSDGESGEDDTDNEWYLSNDEIPHFPHEYPLEEEHLVGEKSLSGEKNDHLAMDVHYPGGSANRIVWGTNVLDSGRVGACVQCLTTQSWDLHDLTDVTSTELSIPLMLQCPVLIHILLKNGNTICADSSQLIFQDVLKKLENQGQ
ncbi:uncharacterized protein [Antennarius striatus]|uniref:uncharacterized protein n=1 Tax=Antennarius striatus TaxID=241820 RepID=UPI0035B4C966